MAKSPKNGSADAISMLKADQRKVEGWFKCYETKNLIGELLKGSPDEDFYDAKVSVHSEMIKHHIKEEEQLGGMFSQARKDDIDVRRERVHATCVTK